MKAIDKIIIVLGLITVVVAVGFVLPALSPPSNCGGNSAALSACQTYATEAQLLNDSEKREINLFGLSTSNRVELANSVTVGTRWCGNVKFLVRTNVVINASPNQIIVVCDTPFDNVPQPTFWNGRRKNPAHAVGYSDGSKGLISPKEFKALNRTQFIDVSELRTNNLAALPLADKKLQ